MASASRDSPSSSSASSARSRSRREGPANAARFWSPLVGVAAASTATLASPALVVREEELLAADIVTRDRLLQRARDDPVDERVAQVLLDVRVLRRVHEHDPVLVEQLLVALDEDREIAAVLEREPGAPVGEDVRAHRRGGVEGRAHAG